ncbi:hypothetical protein GBAR_LOCUS15402 [Geodia barretti]|nr:hypothetical protein GBAR_LOCUS15402 [Geodia barretti]
MTTVFRCNLRLTDVHATAETVGGEFRKLTDRFGMECAAELLSPVVRALEWLEAYVESYQQLQTTVSELEMENDTLEYEREQRALMAAKNESLEGTIRELQKENRCLLMEMDDMYYKNQELSTLLESKIDHPVKHTATMQWGKRVCPQLVVHPPPHLPTHLTEWSTSHRPTSSLPAPPTLPTSHPPLLPPSLPHSFARLLPTPPPLLHLDRHFTTTLPRRHQTHKRDTPFSTPSLSHPSPHRVFTTTAQSPIHKLHQLTESSNLLADPHR